MRSGHRHSSQIKFLLLLLLRSHLPTSYPHVMQVTFFGEQKKRVDHSKFQFSQTLHDLHSWLPSRSWIVNEGGNWVINVLTTQKIDKKNQTHCTDRFLTARKRMHPLICSASGAVFPGKSGTHACCRKWCPPREMSTTKRQGHSPAPLCCTTPSPRLWTSHWRKPWSCSCKLCHAKEETAAFERCDWMVSRRWQNAGFAGARWPGDVGWTQDNPRCDKRRIVGVDHGGRSEMKAGGAGWWRLENWEKNWHRGWRFSQKRVGSCRRKLNLGGAKIGWVSVVLKMCWRRNVLEKEEMAHGWMLITERRKRSWAKKWERKKDPGRQE